MRNPFPYVRKMFQFPVAIVMIAIKSVIELLDFILDHTNTPIANLIDTICLEVLPELGSHGVMLLGAALHAYLYKVYLIGLELAAPGLDAVLTFCAQRFSPVFGSIATSIIPTLSIITPYLFVVVGGIVVLNQLVCMKKIYTESNTANAAESTAQPTANRLEIMRSMPLESLLTISLRLVNKIVNVPAFIHEAYTMACNIKSKVASILWPWPRTTEPLIITTADTQLIAAAALGPNPPMEERDQEVTDAVRDVADAQPLLFNAILEREDPPAEVRDVAAAQPLIFNATPEPEEPTAEVIAPVLKRRNSWPTYKSSF